jgi:S-DNA-T family DNA segregation ATPase FtsK/SpoIIIE
MVAGPRQAEPCLHRPERVWPLRPPNIPVQLAPPPSAPERSGGGALGGMLPMVGSLSIVAFAFIIHSLVYLIVIAVMVVAMVGAGLATVWAQRRSERRRWMATRKRYLEHLDQVAAEADAAAAVQRAGLEGLYPAPAALAWFVETQYRQGVWERRPGDEDFGSVRLGLGAVPAARPVAVASAKSPLVEHDPELAGAADELVRRTSVLTGAPVVIPLTRLGTVAVVGPPGVARDLVGSWVASLAAFHAPGELRVAGWVPLEATREWDWVKWLPHSRDPEGGEGLGRARRAVTTSLEAFGEQLAGIVRPRLDHLERMAESALASRPAEVPGEHVVLVVDGYRPDLPVARLRDLNLALARAIVMGLTVVVLAVSPSDVPSTCGARVEIGADGTLTYLESGPDARVERGILPDPLDRTSALALARRLAPLRLSDGGVEVDESDRLRLVELLGAEDPDALPVEERWLTPRALAGGSCQALLRAPVGRTRQGDPLVLDLKQAAEDGMGPHGILVGATGSGKSELLRSLAASLASRHDPRVLNFLLIDFKGGAAFAELAGLPHVAGLVTNLADDLALIQRVQQALEGELERRQGVLRAAGNLDSIQDYHESLAGQDDAAELAYLVVMVDEFGELLAARPEFLDTFLAIGRLGRSLGMHLLLATQRLDEGRIRGLEPHLRYRICLRTYTAMESRAVLGSPAAFELPARPGLGYLKVDAATTRFKAALVTLPHRPAEADDRRRLLTPVLRPLSLSPAATDGASGPVPATPQRLDLAVLVERVTRAAGTHRARSVWLDPLPDTLTLGQVAERFPGATAASPLAAAVGMVDLPERQSQEPLVCDLSGSGGNLGIAGAPRSGKSSLLRALLVSLCASLSPEELQVYCLDLGGGGLFALAGMPHVGTVVGRGEPEAASRLFRELQALVDERAEAFRRLGVGSVEELRNELEGGEGGEGGPEIGAAHVLCVIDNVGLLRHTQPDLDLMVGELAAAGLQYGIHVIVSANRWLDVRPQLLDALGSRLELRLGDPVDSGVSRAAAAALPADHPGRGLTRSGHVFQAALATFAPDPGTGDRAGLAEAVDRARQAAGGRHAPSITTLPDRILVSEVPGLARAAGSTLPERVGGFLLGVTEFRCRPLSLDLLASGFHLVVAGDGGSGKTTLLRRAVAYLGSSPERVEVHVVDLRRGLLDLADSPGVSSYAASLAATEKMAAELVGTLATRLPPEDASLDQLRAGRSWEGPHHVVVVDDYDLTVSATGGPFGILLELLGAAADIGLHLVLARRASGMQRTAFEPVWQRLRELGPTALLLSGPPEEGPVLAGVTPRHQPPGRGFLVHPGGRPLLVQCCLDEPAEVARGDGAGVLRAGTGR